MLRGRGLTLVEVLVVTGLASLLSLFLLEAFLASRKVTEHGAANLKVQQRCRHLLERLSTMGLTAASPDDIHDAILRPATDDDGPSPELLFYSADDLFGSTPYDPRNPTHHFYRIHRDGPRVLLQLLKDDGTPAATPPPRQLALKVDELEFQRPEVGLLSVRVSASESVRGAKRTIPVHAELRTTLDLPYYIFQ